MLEHISLNQSAVVALKKLAFWRHHFHAFLLFWLATVVVLSGDVEESQSVIVSRRR